MTAEEVPLNSNDGDKQSILVVEDEVLVRSFVSEELRSEGYKVIEAANADDALAVLGSQMRIDIVVTDMQMPGSVDGAGLVQVIRQRWPFLRVVMLSGQAPDNVTRRLLDGLLPKPFVASQLINYLSQFKPPAINDEP